MNSICKEIPQEIMEIVENQIEEEHKDFLKGLGYCHMYWGRKFYSVNSLKLFSGTPNSKGGNTGRIKFSAFCFNVNWMINSYHFSVARFTRNGYNRNIFV